MKVLLSMQTYWKNLWQEMDHYICIVIECNSVTAALKKFIEKNRVFDFLAGLNAEFDQVRMQILGKEEFPSLNETIFMVRTEGSKRGAMLEALPSEGSSILPDGEIKPSMDQKPNFNKLEQPRNSNRQHLCTYCKKSRFTKDTMDTC